MPQLWQLAIVLAGHLACWYAAAWIFDRRQAERTAGDRAMNEQLLRALRDLFEQRERQQP